MVKFAKQQRLEIIKNYYRNCESVVATLRALTPILGRNNLPTRQVMRAIVDELRPNLHYWTFRCEKDVVFLEAKKQSQP